MILEYIPSYTYTASMKKAKSSKKRPVRLASASLSVTKRNRWAAYEDEIPNRSLLASMRAAEKYLKSGNRKVYKTVDALMKSLE